MLIYTLVPIVGYYDFEDAIRDELSIDIDVKETFFSDNTESFEMLYFDDCIEYTGEEYDNDLTPEDGQKIYNYLKKVFPHYESILIDLG